MHAQPSQHPIEILRDRYQDRIEKLSAIFSTDEYLELTGLSEQNLPKPKVEAFLEDLDTILLDATPNKYQRALLKFITELECFHLHIFDEMRPQRMWNPLDEDFASFKSRCKTLSYHISETSYPPSEVILKWLES